MSDISELSIKEILEFSKNIEQESCAFYQKASELPIDENVKKLCLQLSKEESVHYNNFEVLLGNARISEKELLVKVKNVNLEQRLVQTHSITEKSTVKEILEIALMREERTYQLYNTMVSFTNIHEDVIRLFEDLQKQELGHANRIKEMLKQI